MKEIQMTTKQLREQMTDAVAALGDGVAIRLTYRKRSVGVILPIDAAPGAPDISMPHLRDLEIE